MDTSLFEGSIEVRRCTHESETGGGPCGDAPVEFDVVEVRVEARGESSVEHYFLLTPKEAAELSNALLREFMKPSPLQKPEPGDPITRWRVDWWSASKGQWVMGPRSHQNEGDARLSASGLSCRTRIVKILLKPEVIG